jgi:hypothetical protein
VHWYILSAISVMLVGAMIVSARRGVFPSSMVVRDPALAARSAAVSKLINVGMPLGALTAVLVSGGSASAVALVLASFAAIDLAYYVWVCRNNV